jgi:hypothetical protein
MKNNIIYFHPQGEATAANSPPNRLRIETVAGFGLIDSLMFLWLFVWALVAGFQCVSAARFIAL